MPVTSVPEIRIIEKFAHGKIADNSYTEDRLVIGDNIFGVIDGSRGPGYMKTDMIQTALDAAVNIICAFEKKSHTLNPRDLIDELTNVLAHTKQDHQLSDLRYTGGFHLALFHSAKREMWRVGDCQFRFAERTYTNELEVESIGARQRAVFINAMMMRGMTVEEIMVSDAYAASFSTFFAPLLDFANRVDHPLGYGVINGISVPDLFIEVTPIPQEIDEIILSSDGYPILLDNLTLTEQALSGILSRDPLCIGENCTSKGMMPGQCSFDDRTFLRLGI